MIRSSLLSLRYDHHVQTAVVVIFTVFIVMIVVVVNIICCCGMGGCQAGAKIAVDLASFEVVRAFPAELLALIEETRPDFLVCNEVPPPPSPAACRITSHFSGHLHHVNLCRRICYPAAWAVR